MEDVVLHCRSGSAAELESLLETTEKLLESFPCRTPPPFTSWFPAAADRHLPIRPARPAPVISRWTDSGTDRGTDRGTDAQNKPQKPETDGLDDRPPAETENVVSETPNHLLPESEVTRPPPEKHRDVPPVPPVLPVLPVPPVLPVAHSPVKRSWSVFTQRGAVLPSSPSLSKRFHDMVSVHRLHLQQRARWVISEDNCGTARDIEQVWRALSRSVRSSELPTCNATIRRERAEIWVFCDVVQSERVGRLLKDELQLSGTIVLSVNRRGRVFSM